MMFLRLRAGDKELVKIGKHFTGLVYGFVGIREINPWYTTWGVEFESVTRIHQEWDI